MAGIDGYTKISSHFNEIPFIDEIGHSITNNGVTLDTVDKFLGVGCAYFNGSSYLSLGYNIDWYFGANDFNIDFRVKFDDISGIQVFVSQYQAGVAQWQISKDASHKLRIYFESVPLGGIRGYYTMSSSWSGLSTGVWYHLSFERIGTSAKIFIGGISQTLTEIVAFGTNDVGSVNSPLWIGNQVTGTPYCLKGRMDELRFDNGIYRWATDFTPPTEEYSFLRTKTILSDVHFKEINIQKTILSDIEFTPRKRVTITSDVHFKEINIQKTILSDIIFISMAVQKTILSDIKFVNGVIYDINNKFNSAKIVLSNIINKFNSCKRVLSDINNIISFVKSLFYNINNDFRTKKLLKYDAINDIRFIKSWQIVGNVGFQSLGKEYIKVYFDGIEQTDVDIDSIKIDKSLSNTHTASFELARAYDATKPDTESLVLIKYNDWILYRGYITNIIPVENPEHIRIECKDEFWYKNRTNKYFIVGHAPTYPREVYYSTIYTALKNSLDWDIPIGGFVPETIDCFGVGVSDAITKLVQESGNYEYYYDENGTKQLWTAGKGDIITLERQTLGTNIGLYQVLSHHFTENIDNIINKYRVQMGDRVTKKYNSNPKTTKEDIVEREQFIGYAEANWISTYEKLSKNSDNGYGFDHPEPGKESNYKEVYTKYSLPTLDTELESWDDEKEPIVEIDIFSILGWEIKNAPKNTGTPSFPEYILTEGFTIDYKHRLLILSEQIYLYKTDSNGECIATRAPNIKLHLWKKTSHPYTEDIADNPEITVSNPLMFFTSKMGDYPITIIKPLSLTNLSIQQGGYYYDYDTGKYVHYPTWNDVGYANDYSMWQLSKTCDKKIIGTIEITLDALCFYNINLSKRIYIDGITDSIMNIISISYDMSNFICRLEVENIRYYKRTISLPYRGEE